MVSFGCGERGLYCVLRARVHNAAPPCRPPVEPTCTREGAGQTLDIRRSKEKSATQTSTARTMARTSTVTCAPACRRARHHRDRHHRHRHHHHLRPHLLLLHHHRLRRHPTPSALRAESTGLGRTRARVSRATISSAGRESKCTATRALLCSAARAPLLHWRCPKASEGRGGVAWRVRVCGWVVLAGRGNGRGGSGATRSERVRAYAPSHAMLPGGEGGRRGRRSLRRGGGSFALARSFYAAACMALACQRYRTGVCVENVNAFTCNRCSSTECGVDRYASLPSHHCAAEMCCVIAGVRLIIRGLQRAGGSGA